MQSGGNDPEGVVVYAAFGQKQHDVHDMVGVLGAIVYRDPKQDMVVDVEAINFDEPLSPCGQQMLERQRRVIEALRASGAVPKEP